MSFVRLPHLPQKSISSVIIGRDYADILRSALEMRGIDIIECPENPVVDERLRCHIDLSMVHLGENRLLLSRKAATKDFLNKLREYNTEIILTDLPTAGDYPLEAAMCAVMLSDRIFHIETASVFKDDPRLVNVRQGYTKCASCVVADNAVITSDRGVAKAMSESGVDVLLISPEYIDLAGYDCGFIGGSSFKLSIDKIAFTGRLDLHPDRARIYSFLDSYEIEPVFLTDRPLFDIGSAIPLTEK